MYACAYAFEIKVGPKYKRLLRDSRLLGRVAKLLDFYLWKREEKEEEKRREREREKERKRVERERERERERDLMCHLVYTRTVRNDSVCNKMLLIFLLCRCVKDQALKSQYHLQ